MKSFSMVLSVFVIGLATMPSYACSGKVPSEVNSNNKLKALAQWIDEKGKNGQLSGTFLFARKGEVLLKKAVGKVQPDHDMSIALDSSFNLASVSKQFTAMAVMLLSYQGKLDYDASVKNYLAEFPYPKITVRHLLNHTSGLADYMELAEEHWNNKTFTNQDMLDLFSEHRPALAFVSGSKFEYSNTGYVTLSAIVERVSKMSFAYYLKKYVFQPLNMDHTSVVNLLSEPNLLPLECMGKIVKG